MGFLEWLLGINPKNIFLPKPFGPAFQLVEANYVQILEGPLENSVFRMEESLTPFQLRLFLKNNSSIIGRALCDRNPRSGEIIYWDVMVEEKFRMKGLASVMTKYILRELMTIQKKARFMLRMIKLFRPTDTSIKLQNVGIGVIAHRLGLTCEFDLPKVLNPRNILKIDILPPDGIFPPSYKIVLRNYPYVLIGFIVDPGTLKPIASQDMYYQMIQRPEVIEEWIKMKAIVIGNGNYVLKKKGVDEMVNCIAFDEYEAKKFRSKLHGR
jgi:hypothetical protein